MSADLIDAAIAAMARAHAPYSGFAVGAAVRGASGAVYAGCNVENASYPEGCCAETSAIAALVMGGEARCRQRLREFADDSLPIHICGPEGLRRTVTLGELLPLSFGPDNLSD